MGETPVGEGTESVVEAVGHYVEDVGLSLDRGRSLDQVNDVFDSYNQSLGIWGSFGAITGAKGTLNGSIEVLRGADGKYGVWLTGEVGLGPLAQVGGHLGPLAATACIDALVGGGTKLELSFDTKEEARRAAEIIHKSYHPLARGQIPAEDWKFLGSHLKAVELRLNRSGGPFTKLGLDGFGTGFAGLFASASAKLEQAIRFERGPDGSLTVAHREKITLAANGWFGAGLHSRGHHGGAQQGKNDALAVGAAGQVVAFEDTRLPLTDEVLVDLQTDPLGGLTRLAGDLVARGTKTQVIDAQLTPTSVQGTGSGERIRAAFEGARGSLTEAVTHAVGGDLVAALKTMDAEATQLQVTPYQLKGLILEPGASLNGTGGGVSLVSTLFDTPAKMHIDGKMKGPEAVRVLEDYVARGGGPLPDPLGLGNPDPA
jgi:hypothetical protein